MEVAQTNACGRCDDFFVGGADEQQLACDFILVIAKGEIIEMDCDDGHGNDRKITLSREMGIAVLQCVLDLH